MINPVLRILFTKKELHKRTQKTFRVSLFVIPLDRLGIVSAVALFTLLINFAITSQAAIAMATITVPYLATDTFEMPQELFLQYGDRHLTQVAETSASGSQATLSLQEKTLENGDSSVSEESAAFSDEPNDQKFDESVSEEELNKEPEIGESAQNLDSTKPLKTYFLNLISDHPRQQLKIEPPARQIKISVSGGANSVQCGDGEQTYTCASGKPIVITHEKDTLITQFWAQNSGGGTSRIRISVYP